MAVVVLGSNNNFWKTQRWMADLCGCCGNMCNCFLAFVCPCCAMGSVGERMGTGWCGGCCGTMLGGPCYICCKRTDLRGADGINGNCCADCLVAWCCPCCVIAQMLNHLDNKLTARNRGGPGAQMMRA